MEKTVEISAMDNDPQAGQGIGGHVPSPLEVLIQLYEGAIDFLDRSAEACDDGRVEEFKEFLQRGRRIIEEFQKTLDFDQGGQVPAQLNDLYVFMLDSLTQAGLTHDTQYIQRVTDQLQILLGGWRGAQVSIGS